MGRYNEFCSKAECPLCGKAVELIFQAHVGALEWAVYYPDDLIRLLPEFDKRPILGPTPHCTARRRFRSRIIFALLRRVTVQGEMERGTSRDELCCFYAWDPRSVHADYRGIYRHRVLGRLAQVRLVGLVRNILYAAWSSVCV